MANLVDYLDWRGDLPMTVDRFNEVDSLILTELAYIEMGDAVPEDNASVPLSAVSKRLFVESADGKKLEMGVVTAAKISELLHKLARTPRFQDLRLSCFERRLDVENAEQFAALTIELPDDTVYLAFRGTDDTLAGWKENIHLSCMEEVPAQRQAVRYTERVAALYPDKRLRIGGHSKGGNLAMWAGAFCSRAVQDRIVNVWSNDGPGFNEATMLRPELQRIRPRIISIVPKSSVVGMLLTHGEDYIVVDSSQVGILQHDGFSWNVLGPHFIHLDRISQQGRINDLTFRRWVQQVPWEQRERFADGLFGILSASGAVTFNDFRTDKWKTAAAMVKAMKDMDKETRDALTATLAALFRSNLEVRLEGLEDAAKLRRREKEQRSDSVQ